MRPKVLIFIDWFYPAFKSGGPVQSILNLTAHLGEFFDFYVITRDTDYCESIPMKGILSNQWNKINDHLHVYYCSANSIKAKLFKQLFKEINPDVLYINGIFSSKFSILPAYLFKNLRLRKIVGTRGMLAKGALQIKGLKKAAFLFLANQTNLYSNYQLHVTNFNEQEDVINVLGKEVKLFVAPNLPQKITLNYRSLVSSDVLNLINVARISPEKNLIFALQSLKKVKRKILFDIYGSVYNNDYWSRCQAVINELPSNIIVNYKGVLDSDLVINTISQYHLFYMPTLGENYGHVIVQSFMASTPVLISNKTPWQNLESLNCGFDLDLSQPELFSSLIDNVDMDLLLKWRKGAFLMAQNTVNNTENISLNKQLLWPNNS
jgi:glycosyltransferase involved in cell wall biosynthesis